MTAHLEPLIIGVAPTGARRTRQDHPAIPIDIEEIVREARLCEEAGARLFHLHVRDAGQMHSLDAGLYRQALSGVEAATSGSMLIQITTEACGVYDPAAQMQVVRDVRPAAASFAVRELFDGSIHADVVTAFFDWVHDAGIAAQFILYSLDDVSKLIQLIERGMLRFPTISVLFVIGRDRLAAGVSAPMVLMELVAAWDDRGPWSACAFGTAELQVAATAISLGGNVRVGFENNIWRLDGSLLESNAEQVRNVARLAKLLGRPF